MTTTNPSFAALHDHRQWDGVTASNQNETATAFVLARPLALATLEVTSANFSGSTGRFQGTVDPVPMVLAGTATWFDLRDRFGLVIGVTANGLVELTSGVTAVRPRVDGGTGALNFHLSVAGG